MVLSEEDLKESVAKLDMCFDHMGYRSLDRIKERLSKSEFKELKKLIILCNRMNNEYFDQIGENNEDK